MKIFSILTGKIVSAFASLDPDEIDEREHWVRDPLSHPELEVMSQRFLGDLPFQRGYRSAKADCLR